MKFDHFFSNCDYQKAVAKISNLLITNQIFLKISFLNICQRNLCFGVCDSVSKSGCKDTELQQYEPNYLKK